MRYWVGFDVGKAFHWVCVLDGEGEEVLSRRVEASEEDLEAACSEVAALGGERTVGLDLVGGPATLLEAVLFERGEQVFHVPGVAVNRARDAYPGEAKTDARDARVIADQLRLRRGALQEVRPREEAELRLLVAHRRDLLQDQTRRAARLREVLLGVFPGLEAALDFKREGALLAVTKVASPAAARRLGEGRLCRWLKGRGGVRPRTWPAGSLRPPRPSAANCRPPRPRRPSWPRSPRRSCAPGGASPSSTVVWRSCWRRFPRRGS